MTNPEATAALEKEELKEATKQEDKVEIVEPDEVNEEDNLSLLIQSVEQLYGDLALFSTDEIVQDMTSEMALF